MKKNKKIIAILLIIIVISLIIVFLTRYVVKKSTTRNVGKYDTMQASTTEDGRFEYEEFLDGTIAISKYIGKDTVVEIPSTIAGKRVTSIKSKAFSGCSSLTSITIPEGVTSIGEYAFFGCKSLTSITISKGVTSIGTGAFESCSNLTQITLPKGLGEIYSSVFKNCDSLTSITIPEGVTSIGGYAFSGCKSLTSITIPEGVTSIEYGAFDNCFSLSKINVNINNNYFASKDGILFDKNYTTLIKYPGKHEITQYEIPKGVTKIKDRAFENCHNLISVKISSGVTTIGNEAFFGCYRLGKVNISESVNCIGRGAFKWCKSLISIVIPEGVTKIESDTFDSCSNLRYVKIPQTATSIGNRAFESCHMLEEINIPDSITYIENSAFSNSELTIWKVNTTAGDEIELPSMIRQALDKNHILYCNEEIELENCTLNKDKTKLVLKYNVNSRLIAKMKFKGGVLGSGNFTLHVLSDYDKPTAPRINNLSGGNWTNKDITLTVCSDDADSGIAKIQYSYDKSYWYDLGSVSLSGCANITVDQIERWTFCEYI